MKEGLTPMTKDTKTIEQLCKDPDWNCPSCRYVNLAIRDHCRKCRYDSNVGEFPYYNPLPPYQGRFAEEQD